MHVTSKNKETLLDASTTSEHLDYVLSDSDKNNVKCTCLNLKSVAEELIAQKKTIETLP